MAKKKAEEKSGLDLRAIVLACAVVVLAAAAYLYYNQGQAVVPPVKGEQPKASPLESPAAKLLLSAYDAGMKLQDYRFAYSAVEDGVVTNYALYQNGTSSFVQVNGSFGSMEGFFGPDNRTDVVCLAYRGETQCGMTGENAEAQQIANSLRILRPDEKTYSAQRTQLVKFISAGAVTFEDNIAGERVGQFDTQKVSYRLDLRKLTVQALLSAGISPNDPSLISLSDQAVSFWIDKKTGLLVKSLATYKENLAQKTFATEHSQLELGPAAVPAIARGVVAASSFVKFYLDAEKDFQARETCLMLPVAEQGLCLKSLAVEELDWEICELIEDKKEYESCALIVAQRSNNPVLCGKLELLPDDCYIAVAGETGNFELCKNLKNSSLGASCSQAATEGAKKVVEKLEAERRVSESRNCATDSDCSPAGSAGQYCVPKNDSRAYGEESSPLFACLKGVPCGCAEGFCSLRKNDTYYSCVNNLEEEELKQIISEIAKASNSTNKSG